MVSWIRTWVGLGLASGRRAWIAGSGRMSLDCAVKLVPVTTMGTALPRSAPRGSMLVKVGGAATSNGLAARTSIVAAGLMPDVLGIQRPRLVHVGGALDNGPA